MRHSDTISVLIPDGESHMLIYVVNCLRQKENCNIHVMSSERDSPLRYSRFLSSYTYYPDHGNDRQWIQKIDELSDKHRINVIIPIWEIGIRRILQNKELLQNVNRLSILPSLHSFDTAIDKWRLYSHLVKNSFPCPKTVLFEGHGSDKIYAYPSVVKPTKGFGGGMDISLIETNSDLFDYFQGKDINSHTYILQEFIEGTDYTVSVLCLHGRVVAHTIQRSEDIGKGQFGPQMRYRFEKNKRLFDLASAVMGSLAWSGIASIDFRYDLKEDEYKILEVNPRFWRSLYGSLYAGVNFPHLWADLTLDGEIDEFQGYRNISFYDLKGYVSMIGSKPYNLFNLKLMKDNTPMKLVLTHPLPYIYKFIWRSKNILFRKLKIRKGG